MKNKWNNERLDQIAKDLVDQMTVEEAASQLTYGAKAIERLGIPEYNWWNETLHGVARAGTATVFPQAIGMAAMFDAELLQKIGDICATEARGKYNALTKENDRDIYKGLTFWTPNINIFRDPRWGRGHETYGEDPYLTATLGKAMIRGLQGDGEYIKAAACAKHFAVHSGPEALRHEFNACPTPKDLEETYLPAFEAAVKEANVESVMGAYNAVNGEPACCNEELLVNRLRGEWEYDGHVVSDCWALQNFHETHHYTKNSIESASIAIKRGCDINCGCTYDNLMYAYEKGMVTKEEIKACAYRAMRARARLGMFTDDCEYDNIPYTAVDTKENRMVARKAAEESMVLLKNDGILPLKKDAYKTIAVIGPNAYSNAALYGNYYGMSSHYVTNLEGIQNAADENDIRVLYSRGCCLGTHSDDNLSRPDKYESEAIAAAKATDLVILCFGLDEFIEGEEGDASNSDASGDKIDLLLPDVQRQLYDRLKNLGKKMILVVNAGSSIDVSAFDEKTSAIVQSWYSGEEGGNALAEILFGKISPSGRLPITFYYNDNTIPEFTDYHMAGRTYKFIKEAPLYPFGYGLSYTDFTYSGMQVNVDETVQASVDVENTGACASDEVVELFVRYEGEAFEKPNFTLQGFKRITLAPGEKTTVTFDVPKKQLMSVLEDGSKELLKGEYTIFVGGNAPDARSIELTGKAPMEAKITF